MNASIEEIVELSKLHPIKVRNIYLYGSRVYGNCREDSDFDIMLIGCSLLETQEICNDKYNVHIHVPSKFEDDLRKHDIHALECIWAPDFAKLQIKRDYTNEFVLNKNRLKVMLLSQSYNAWNKGKMRIKDTDIYRGTKSIYHSLRILLFGIQIAKHGKIVDFSESNKLHDEILGSNQFEWSYFKDKYFSYKKELEENFKVA